MDIHNQINKIIEKTTEDKIEWKTLNPFTFRWVTVRNNIQFITTLQVVNIPQNQIVVENVANPIGNGTFVFTLQTLNPNETLIQLQVTSQDNREYIYELLELYNLIIEKTKKNYSKILDSLLDSL